MVFTYRGYVQGNGFVAVVDAVSHVLAEEQAGGYIWMNGAQPGGLAAGGDDLDEAYSALKDAFCSILLDTAEAAEDFTAFRDETDRFFKDSDHLVAKQWQYVWTANRRGELDCGPADRLLRVKGDEQLPAVNVAEARAAEPKQDVNAQDIETSAQPHSPRRTKSIPSDIATLAA